MNVMGLDLSLTAPGFATKLGAYAIKPPHKGVERLSWVYDYITRIVFTHSIQLVVIENYAFGASFKREALGEVGGVARLALYKKDVPFIEIAPTGLKKFATGKGNATKDQVLAAAIKRSDLEIDNNNAADAWWLYQIGCWKYAPDLAVSIPVENETALSKVDWLEFDEAS